MEGSAAPRPSSSPRSLEAFLCAVSIRVVDWTYYMAAQGSERRRLSQSFQRQDLKRAMCHICHCLLVQAVSHQSMCKGRRMEPTSSWEGCQKSVAVFNLAHLSLLCSLHVCKKILVIYGPSKNVTGKRKKKSQMRKQGSV